MTALAGAGRVTLLTFVALVLATATVGCSPEKKSASEKKSAPSEKKSAPSENAAAEGITGSPVVFAAGDIADCRSEGDEATTKLLEETKGTILTLGDNAYEKGSAEDFADCYSPTWGRFKDRTRPAPGNHEYNTEAAEGYFDYFGEAAGDPDEGYYSYDVGEWHLVALNSNCEEVGGCYASSPQVRWLKADLRRHQAACTLAYWHHPLFSSGTRHGNTPAVRPLWEALYEAGADVILAGHEHNYERFAPQDPSGEADPERGIREFVVGTGGGGSHYPILDPIANSEVHNDDTYGVLKLTLR
jgi:hypothetical protein